MKMMDKKIMIVDDDADILVTLRSLFEKQQFEVLTVDSGSDCIKELEQGFKGIVLMDLMMPFMDGLETINEIIKRGLNKGILLSIITAKGSSSSEEIKDLEFRVGGIPLMVQNLCQKGHTVLVETKAGE